MKISAPAKLNLTLRILCRREDGFHELETLMVPLPGLADQLIVDSADEFSLVVEGADVGAIEDNLVTRALRLFEQKLGRPCNYQIELRKTVPAGAGLGGGSSDAASILLALNELEGAGFSLADLEPLAAQLGSDIPFFLRKGACWARGRGEILEGADVVSLPVLLLKPSFGVNTVDAYKRWQDSQELPGVSYREITLDGVTLVNDLERPVFEKFLFLAELKGWLSKQEGVRAAMMSGSGATVFAVLENETQGAAIAERARGELDPTLWSWVGTTG